MWYSGNRYFVWSGSSCINCLGRWRSQSCDGRLWNHIQTLCFDCSNVISEAPLSGGASLIKLEQIKTLFSIWSTVKYSTTNTLLYVFSTSERVKRDQTYFWFALFPLMSLFCWAWPPLRTNIQLSWSSYSWLLHTSGLPLITNNFSQ